MPLTRAEIAALWHFDPATAKPGDMLKHEGHLGRVERIIHHQDGKGPGGREYTAVIRRPCHRLADPQRWCQRCEHVDPADCISVQPNGHLHPCWQGTPGHKRRK